MFLLHLIDVHPEIFQHRLIMTVEDLRLTDTVGFMKEG